MAANNNLVSVIIPAFNAERWIAQTLVSIRSQTHQELEIIVVDDGSADRTAEVAAKALVGFPGRVEIVRQPNKGLPAARNVGFRASRGHWVHFMDADDLVSSDMISLLYREALRNPAAAVIHGPMRTFTEDASGQRRYLGETHRPIVDPAAPASLLSYSENVLVQSSLVNRDWFETIGGFNEALRFVAEDRDFNIRMALAGGRYIYVNNPEPVCLWRMYPEVRRLGGRNSRYRASESMFVWMMSLKRCVGTGTLKDCHLKAKHEAEIIHNTQFLLRCILNDGLYDEFDCYVKEFRQIVPGFVPSRPVVRRVLAKLLGYDAAVAIDRVATAPIRRPMRPESVCRYNMAIVSQFEKSSR